MVLVSLWCRAIRSEAGRTVEDLRARLGTPSKRGSLRGAGLGRCRARVGRERPGLLRRESTGCNERADGIGERLAEITRCKPELVAGARVVGSRSLAGDPDRFARQRDAERC